MGNMGLLKRMLPFFATFAFGIFIASFFVNIGGPRFGHHEGGKCRHEMRDLRFGYEQQREEIRQLREQLDDVEMGTTALDGELPLDINVPLPPPPPVRQKHAVPKAHK